jgi:alkyldihydroxyacetonephosphate synthase
MSPPGGRRWNGWGDPAVVSVLPASAVASLLEAVGPATPPRDAALPDALAGVPPSRFAEDAASDLSTDPEDRLRHARGQSLPDWIALRSGQVPAVPDAVARPATAAEVRDLLDRARREGWTMIPYGGGTSVVGGVTVGSGDRPVISVDLTQVAGPRGDPDPLSGLTTFGAGTTGPALEAALGEHGLTLGHYPQSFEFSTVGGWVAARSAGQESLGAGRIEALFAGGHVETPEGPLDLPPSPASAAGPDLRQVVLGSEGRLGVITDVIVRAVSRPERAIVRAYSVPDEGRAFELGRHLARAGLPLRFIRVSTAAETRATIAQVADDRRRALLGRYMRWRRQGDGAAFVLVAMGGSDKVVRATEGEVGRLVRASRGIGLPGVGAAWRRQRFASAYLRNALWDAGYATDTLETAVPWPAVVDLTHSLETILRDGLRSVDERVLAFCHLSHLYPSGSSIYATYVFRLADDPDATLERWRRLKTAGSEAIVSAGGTISHQHGVGRDHAAYLGAEKGALGMGMLEALVRRVDPEDVMQRGVLLDDGQA